MKLAIVGSRNITSEQKRQVYNIIIGLSGLYDDFSLVSGGAVGVDSVAGEVAFSRNCKLTVFLPDWGKYGKSAGYIRNKQIVDECDKLIAFWDGESKGTQHSINLAKEAGKLMAVFYIDNL